MRSKINEPWIPLDRIEAIVQLEPALALAGLALGSFLVYRLLLRRVSEERHRNLKNLFLNLLGHFMVWLTLFITYISLRQMGLDHSGGIDRLSSYVGFLTVVSGATVFVKTSRILVFEYLFLGHMREGVPLLLVNLSTLLLSMILGAWIATEIFGVKLAPLIATSAVLSLVMGLALQDTLGNLFAGVAMQFDKPYGIGDWVEVNNGDSLWVGQVYEISWRATVLVGFGDELLTIPNRIMAQAEISNFTLKGRPILRRQTFRVAPEVDPEMVKSALMRAIKSVPSISQTQEPRVIVTETHESWIPYKVLYYLEDYGVQYLIADEVIEKVRSEFLREGIQLATTRMQIETKLAK